MPVIAKDEALNPPDRHLEAVLQMGWGGRIEAVPESMPTALRFAHRGKPGGTLRSCVVHQECKLPDREPRKGTTLDVMR